MTEKLVTEKELFTAPKHLDLPEMFVDVVEQIARLGLSGANVHNAIQYVAWNHRGIQASQWVASVIESYSAGPKEDGRFLLDY